MKRCRVWAFVPKQFKGPRVGRVLGFRVQGPRALIRDSLERALFGAHHSLIPNKSD